MYTKHLIMLGAWIMALDVKSKQNLAIYDHKQGFTKDLEYNTKYSF